MPRAPLNTAAVQRFRYTTDQPLTANDIFEKLLEHQFVEPISAAQAGTLGWVDLTHPKSGLDYNSSTFNQYVVASLRIDTKKLPAKLLAAELDERCRSWLADTGQQRCPAAVKRELKEQIELELLPRQLASLAVYDVVFDTISKTVWFFGRGTKTTEAFVRHANKTLDLQLERVCADTIYTQDGLNEPVDTAEFLTWLKFSTSSSTSVWLDEWVRLAGNKRTSTFKGNNPTDSAEVRAALNEGCTISAAIIGMKTENRTYTLKVDSNLDWTAVKLPSEVKEKEDIAETIYERIYLLDELAALFDELFRTYANLRHGAAWPGIQTNIRQWAEALA